MEKCRGAPDKAAGLEVVSIGQVLRVMVISVDEKRGRIGLSLKRVPEEVSV